MTLLNIENLNSYYMGVRANRDISLTVEEDEIVAVLGRNGAGKTTLLKSIVGITPPETSGKIEFKGKNLVDLPAHEIGSMKIGISPEEEALIPEFTLNENLNLALRKNTEEFEERLESVLTLFPMLKDLQERKGEELSGGERRMAAIAMALIREPDLLLLDEPFEGLSPGLAEDFSKKIRKLEKRDMGILLTESNVDYGLRFSDRVCVLERGEIKFSGTSEEFEERRSEFREILA